MTLSGIAQMLRRHGWSRQIPARRASILASSSAARSWWCGTTVRLVGRRPGPGSDPWDNWP
ncbi:transposase, partial [Streptomyces sp900105245]